MEKKGDKFRITDYFLYDHMGRDDRVIFIKLFIGFAELENKRDEAWWEEFEDEWMKFWSSGSGGKGCLEEKLGWHRVDDSLPKNFWT